jgi:hypothetical protein
MCGDVKKLDKKERNQNRQQAWEECFIQEIDGEENEGDREEQEILDRAFEEVRKRKAANERHYEALGIRQEIKSLERRTAECWLCGQEKPAHIHHIDGNHHSNSLINRAVLCESCHVGIHRNGRLLDNEQFALMRNEIKKRFPDRFKGNAKNPFDRPNSMGPVAQQFDLPIDRRTHDDDSI